MHLTTENVDVSCYSDIVKTKAFLNKITRQYP